MPQDEPSSGAASVQPKPSATPYKDRSSGLIVFGVLTILLGCLAGLFVPLMLIGQVAAAKATGASSPLSTMLPAMSIYGALAVALVWLGIGSVMARRWARALLVIFCWSWFIVGVFVLVFMLFLLPRMMTAMSAGAPAGQPAMPEAAMVMAMVFTGLIIGVFFVILPAVWTCFYSSRHVKATCEARDPVARWTDACPLPLLGFCLWLVLGSLTMLIMPLAGHGVMPFFGRFLAGLPGTLFCLAVAGSWGYGAWRLFRLDPRGWWLILITLGLVTASALMTYPRHDMIEMYRLMGYPEAQIEQIQKIGLLTGNGMMWLTGCSMVPFLGYLLFIKRYLGRK